MSRKIKFRAWDTVEQDMVYDFAYDGGEMLGFIVSIDEAGLSVEKEGNADPDRFILMQSTGLKDKNGKDGYEGDLLRHDSRNQGKPIEIIWFDGGWCGKYRPNGHHSLFHLTANEMREAVIVGSIHENPELLQK